MPTDREQLALAFRLAERFGFHEGICNHFSLRVDQPDEQYLINPYGLHWSEIEADTLLLIDGDGRILEGVGEVEDTARFIHVAGHRANARHRVLLHTHMPWATTLTLLAEPAGMLQMAHQTDCRFAGRMARENTFGGLAHDEGEGERLAASARQHPEVDITFLAHHGVVVGGPSVALAFDDLYYLERACRQQVLALQTGQPLVTLADQLVKDTSRQAQRDLVTAADAHFAALGRVLEAHPNRVMTF